MQVMQMMQMMRRKIFVALILVLALSFSGIAFAEYSVMDLFEMTKQSLVCDRENNLASVLGVGKFKTSDSHSVLLARRAALTSARRGLLILRERILTQDEISQEDLRISGTVPPLRLISEDTNPEQKLYFVSVQVSLSELLGENALKALSEIQNLQ